MSTAKRSLSVDFLNEVERAAHQVGLAEGRVTLRMFDLGEIVERRPSGTTYHDVAQAVWDHVKRAAKAAGKDGWNTVPRPSGTSEASLSKAGTTYREWVVEAGRSPKSLREWSFDMLYQWRPKAVGMDVSDILSERRTAAPKEEEIAQDSPKAKAIRKRRAKQAKGQVTRAAKGAPKGQQAVSESESPAPALPKDIGEAAQPKAATDDWHKVVVDDATFRRLVAIRETDRKAYRNLSAVVSALLDMAEAMSKGATEGDTAAMLNALPKGVNEAVLEQARRSLHSQSGWAGAFRRSRPHVWA